MKMRKPGLAAILICLLIACLLLARDFAIPPYVLAQETLDDDSAAAPDGAALPNVGQKAQAPQEENATSQVQHVQNPAPVSVTIQHGDIRFRLRQSFSNLPDLKIWFEVIDAGGQMLTGLAPMNFQATVGNESASVSSVQALREASDVSALILLIDRSASMSGKAFQDATAAAEMMVEKMNPGDLMAVASFGDDYRLEADFTSNAESLKEALKAIKPSDKRTRMYDAIHSVMAKLDVIADPAFPKMKAILIISDGDDDGSRATIEEIEDQLQKNHIPIFSVGYLKNPAANFNALQQLANLSWGVHTKQKEAEEITQAFSKFLESIGQGQLLSLSCEACEADGTIQKVFLRFNYQKETYTGNIAADMISFAKPAVKAPLPEAAPRWKNQFLLAGLIGAALFILILLVFIFRGSKEGESLDIVQPEMPTHKLQEKPPAPAPVKKYGQDPLRLVKFTLVSGAGELHPPGPYRITSEGVILGREGDIRLGGDGEVSARHSRLRLEEGIVVIEDLDSTNGTIHNGGKVQESERLETGDDLQFGRTLFRVEISGR